MIIKENENTIISVKKIVILKSLYKFLRIYYKSVKVISIDLVDEEVYLYLDNKKTVPQPFAIKIQRNILKYLTSEFGLDIDKVNILNI